MAQIIKADLDEMVFENKERRYGAYDLRKSYPKRLIYSIAALLLVVALVLLAPRILGMVSGPEVETTNKEVNIDLADLPPPPPIEDAPEPPPPPPEKIPPPQIKTVEFKIPEPKPKEEIDPEEDQTITEQDSLEDAPVIGLENIEGDTVGVFDGDLDGEEEEPVVVAEAPKKEEDPDINAFVFVQEEPKPVNMDDIKKAIGYPQIARDAGIEGDVVIRVLVDEFGNYTKHKVIKQVHPILAKACSEKVGKLKFTPAVQGGKPIKFWVNIPFKFKLVN